MLHSMQFPFFTLTVSESIHISKISKVKREKSWVVGMEKIRRSCWMRHEISDQNVGELQKKFNSLFNDDGIIWQII